jgi:hypothetical protein
MNLGAVAGVTEDVNTLMDPQDEEDWNRLGFFSKADRAGASSGSFQSFNHSLQPTCDTVGPKFSLASGICQERSFINPTSAGVGPPATSHVSQSPSYQGFDHHCRKGVLMEHWMVGLGGLYLTVYRLAF